MSNTMKAIRMYAPRDLRLEQVSIPEIKDNEALIKIMAVGICGSDIPRINQYGAHSSTVPQNQQVLDLVAGGRLNVEKYISAYALKDADIAFQSLIDETAEKAVLIPCFEGGIQNLQQNHSEILSVFPFPWTDRFDIL